MKCFVYSSCRNGMTESYNGAKSVQPNISDKLESHSIRIWKVIRISIVECERLSLPLVQTSREGTKKMKVKYDCISAWSLTPFETTFTSQFNFISFLFFNKLIWLCCTNESVGYTYSRRRRFTQWPSSFPPQCPVSYNQQSTQH